MKKSLMIALALFAGIFSACENEKEETAKMEIASTDIDALKTAFTAASQSRTAQISTNLDVVKVSTNETWCKAEILDDDGKVLRVSVVPNEGFKNRNAEVTVYGKGVTDIVIPISQLSSHPSLTVDKPDGINVVDGNLEFSLTVTANLEFTFNNTNWILDNGDNTPVVGVKTYKFKVAAIGSGASRNGTIKIEVEDETYEDLNKTITVAQTQSILNPEVTTFSPATAKRNETVTLSGANFGTATELVTVYFGSTKATVTSVTNNAIVVSVPKVPDETTAANVECNIKVVIDGDDFTYAAKFNYAKSWYLSTVTGKKGQKAFKAGTLAEGQVRARYIAVDSKNNIFLSHRDNGDLDHHIVKISEKDNSVVALGGPFNKAVCIPNAPTVLPDGRVLVANDVGNATAGYKNYILDPEKNWALETDEVTYDASPGSIWIYRYSYNPKDNYLYGLTSNTVFKIKTSDNTGTKLFGNATALHPYAHLISSEGILYIMCSNAASGYGIWKMDLSNAAAGFIKINKDVTETGAATGVDKLNDGPLASAGFGKAWGMDFGPDGCLYLADENNHIIRKVDLVNNTAEVFLGKVGTVGNTDGKEDTATFNKPYGVAWNNDGTAMYISDFENCLIRKWAYE